MQQNPLEQMQRKQRKTGQNQQQSVSTLLVLLGLSIISIFLIGFPGVLFTGMIVYFLVMALKTKKKQDAREGSVVQTAQPKPQPVRCDNPEPHRHFEAPKPQPTACTKPEPHRHADRAANRMTYEQYSREKRRASLGYLLDAGLLTREEYKDQLRRLG